MPVGKRKPIAAIQRSIPLCRRILWTLCCSAGLCAQGIVSPGHASVVLTYDSSTIQLAPGAVTHIGATLSVVNDGGAFSSGLTTDANAGILGSGQPSPPTISV